MLKHQITSGDARRDTKICTLTVHGFTGRNIDSEMPKYAINFLFLLNNLCKNFILPNPKTKISVSVAKGLDLNLKKIILLTIKKTTK